MSAQVAADLRAAAEVLRRDGWTQGQYGDVDGPKCLVGALNTVTGSVPWIGTYRAVDARTLLFQLFGGISWNDKPERTADEVIAALEEAAQVAEQQP